ncbi:MAG: esterase family protein [Saprospiraceae bacterium]|jgi:enterochelin esterase-like enzyme|nr:esterase family protein [Saprospiraceae bacterium]MBK7435443.1 esterase family protein [Saprospiraceae bacterium]MBK8282132.1 esterase family protein [Saprospiraceae bacterium]MBK9681109.1 esterase family protein [Saprospiraceae bacterium]MBK9930081.1 esterase family protein [Saprospiraceae bacterium]
MIRFVSLLVSSIFAFGMTAQSGKVYDNLSLPSKILNMERKYAIYLPPDYETSSRSYPVLYLLHGGGDDQTGWVQFGEVQNITDKAINEGKATPMIIIMPDANTGRRGYSNNATGTWLYEDFFFKELMPFVEKKYRIKSDKRYRAIAGLSMGGDGSFTYALHHPELFSSACPLSAGTGPLSLEDAMTRVKRSDSTATDAQIKAYYEKQSVLHLINNVPEDQKKAVRWYIDCGDDDFLYEGNSLAHIAMRKQEIPHEFRTRDGKHSWVYWRAALPEVLDFVSQAFHQN